MCLLNQFPMFRLCGKRSPLEYVSFAGIIDVDGNIDVLLSGVSSRDTINAMIIGGGGEDDDDVVLSG
jgi:hypothetical protein